MSPEIVTAVMFGGLIVTLILGIPIAFGMGGIACAVMLYFWGVPGLYAIVLKTFDSMWNFNYIAVPLFISMGVLLESAGIAEALFETIYRWSGKLRGGLAIGTVAICAIFAAMTGTISAATITMGLIALPAMLRRGYDKGLAVGVVAGAGTLGILIPPSINMIILAEVAQVSIGQLFMAGVFPGLLLVVLFMLYIAVRAYFQPHLAPAHTEKFTLKQKIASSRAVIAPGLIILAVLGVIFLGIATPTESSAVGVLAVVIVAAVNRRLSWPLWKKTLLQTFRVTGLAMWLLFAGMVFTGAYFASGGSQFVSGLLAAVGSNKWLVIAIALALVFILGCFISEWAIIFILAPLVFPIARELNINLIWLGAVWVMMGLTGLLTPPFGWSLFYLKAVAPPEVKLTDIYRAIWPFVGLIVIGTFIVILFPQIATWLPELLVRIRQ